MFGEAIQPFVLSPELANPANTFLPAADFTPPDNQAPIPNLVAGGNLGWNWMQYADFSADTNPVPVVAVQPAATVPAIINEPQAALEAKAASPLLIVGGVIAALYLLRL